MPGTLRELECLSAVTAVLDLANGLDDDKSLLTGVFALELAQRAGLPDPPQRAAFFVGLLRHLGCTAYSAVESQLADDDIALRGRLIRSDASKASDKLSAIAGASSSAWSAARGLGRLLTSTRRLRTEWTQEVCGAARVLSEQLGFGDDVVRALEEVFERWDGAGGPRGLKGDAISELGRLAQAAHVAVVFYLTGGVSLSREVLALRSGNALEPRWAALASDQIGGFRALVENPERLERAERLVSANPLDADLKTIALTFGDVADLQSPFTRGHSRRVAELCGRAGRALGLTAGELGALELAAHFHDIGHAALPTGLWLTPKWTESDRKRGAQHSYFTERVLSGAPALAEVAALAAAHHERVDGRGTHKGLAGAALPRAARLLAAADVLCALKEPRPHRPACDGPKLRGLARDAVKQGQLDADCVAAVLEATGEPATVVSGPMRELTERELDVLKLLARGQTNKEIARALRISDRTVQHHTIHIYGKLQVSTRAAAALLAARAGLL